MRKSLYWLFWLYIILMTWEFLDKEWEVISQAPVTMLGAIVLIVSPAMAGAFWFAQQLNKGQNEALKSHINHLESHNRQLEYKLQNGSNFDDKSSLLGLEEKEIRAIEKIERFERSNPREENKLPLLYTVEQLHIDLDIDLLEANEIIRKLKALNLAYCPWENEATFMNTSRPMGEEKPVMLTDEGRYRLYAHRRKR